MMAEADGQEQAERAGGEPLSLERALLARLLGEVARGDRSAFEQLYRRTSAKLFAICLRILTDNAAAEEALQETYLSVWRYAARFDDARGGAAAWLASVARSRAIDRFRARRRMEALPIEAAGEVADSAPSAETAAAEQGEARRLIACVATLDPRDVGLIRAAFFQGSTYAELATRAGQPLGTVKSRIRRALLKLRDCLQ